MANGKISAAERALIKGCAENGVAIEDLGNGSTFRFTPAAPKEPSDYAKPSARGTVAVAVAPWVKGLKLRNWAPARISLDPMYQVAMAGDDPALTQARRSYHHGDAKPLRDYLANRNKNA